MTRYLIVAGRRANKARIVEAMIGLLAGPGLRITLDGDMTQTEEDFGQIPGAVCHDPCYADSPHRILPGHYCMTMPIENESLLFLLRSILHRIGIRTRVRHIEIRPGECCSLSYDRWSDYCSGVDGLTEEQLWCLVDMGLLKRFGTDERHPYRYIPVTR